MSKNNPKIIGICGLATAGKNVFADLLQAISPNQFVQDAFADKLKFSLSQLIRDEFGWDIFNLTGEQKRIVRPLMVELGRAHRELNENHWVESLGSQYVDGFLEDKTLIITDFRYVNEYRYFRDKYRKSFLMVDIVREGVEPPNEEERINYPLVSALADVKITWPTVGKDNLSELKQYAADFYNIYFR